MTPPTARPALVALLHGLIDYAGLFPPAGLPMRDAVRSYHEHRNGETAWALGRFVVPAARLEEFEQQFAIQFGGGMPWRLSVLAGPDDATAVEAFNARVEGRAMVDAVEGKAMTVGEVATLAEFGERFATFVEVPVTSDPEALVVAAGAHGLRAKVRTGGLTAVAIPSPAQVARFLAACAAHRVPFKATAGLHHPWRGMHRLGYDPRSETAEMFGFLNVFLAAGFLHDGMSELDVVPLLEERDHEAIAFDAAGASWRGHCLATEQLREVRSRFATSFGSCSFFEPIDELVAAGLL